MSSECKLFHNKQQRINADPSTLFKDVCLSIHVPVLPFPVKYYLRHVQNGKNEFLPTNDRLPLNRDYEFQETGSEGIYTVQIPEATPQIGFQFKCFAVCADCYASSLADALRTHFNYSDATYSKCLDISHQYYQDEQGRKFSLVDSPLPNSGTVWFFLPNYGTYITFDPYIKLLQHRINEYLVIMAGAQLTAPAIIIWNKTTRKLDG